ncbi:C-type lectin domain family 4 member M-like [Anabas testudineus]|uniref:C-type lectin domain family 4 member M-like n=1 Tax=Anabas testudineus TaxID=64144 RepID=UPI000E45B9E5|nr:C-type lectin domain family 4 member M-like [Anabas testudineus]
MKQLKDQIPDILGLEKEELLFRYDDLNKNYTLIQDKHADLEVRHSRLQSRYETLNKKQTQTQDEVKKLKVKIEGKCPEGWTRFRCSCYFKSTEKKGWFDSRTDCENRGSDLVMINSKEEQEFVTQLNANEESWIGLKTNWTSAGFVWEWVDGSTLTETVWAVPEFKDPTEWSNAACCDQQGRWTQSRDYGHDRKTWICEN